MRSKEKGFTLIELLAVIVILAVIALIATPQLLKVIETAKQGSAESSVLGYIDAFEKQIAINEVEKTNTKMVSGVYDIPLASSYGLEVKGKAPSSGWIEIVNNEVDRYSLIVGNYVISYDGNEKTTIKGSTINGKPKAKLVAAKQGETHKGIVYLDPTDLTKYCIEENSVSTTETKIGCMKWYIFAEDANNYTMILDHNTTARIKWNDLKSNVAYESSNLKTVVDDLVTTSGWQVTPRLITAEEVNTIVGGVATWNVNDKDTWFYFEGTGANNQIMPTYNATNRSSYDWLYNNLNKCKTDSTDYGCTIEDNNSFMEYGTSVEAEIVGYWTSTTVGTAGTGSRVWIVIRDGNLYSLNSNNTKRGIRPVITVSKTIFE